MWSPQATVLKLASPWQQSSIISIQGNRRCFVVFCFPKKERKSSKAKPNETLLVDIYVSPVYVYCTRTLSLYGIFFNCKCGWSPFQICIFPSKLAKFHDLSPAVHIWSAEQHLLIANPPLTNKVAYVDWEICIHKKTWFNLKTFYAFTSFTFNSWEIDLCC